MLQPGFLSVLNSRAERTNIELSKAESETESKLEGIQNLIQLFVEYHTEWRQLASVVAVKMFSTKALWCEMCKSSDTVSFLPFLVITVRCVFPPMMTCLLARNKMGWSI